MPCVFVSVCVCVRVCPLKTEILLKKFSFFSPSHTNFPTPHISLVSLHLLIVFVNQLTHSKKSQIQCLGLIGVSLCWCVGVSVCKCVRVCVCESQENKYMLGSEKGLNFNSKLLAPFCKTLLKRRLQD